MTDAWYETGLSFHSAVEAGAFLQGQGFEACDGGFQKVCELSGSTVYASYVLTRQKCFIRLLDPSWKPHLDYAGEPMELGHFRGRPDVA